MDSRALLKRGDPKYDKRIESNTNLCDSVKGTGYGLLDKKCPGCTKAEKQNEGGDDNSLGLDDEVDSDTGSLITVLYEGEPFVRARSKTPS